MMPARHVESSAREIAEKLFPFLKDERPSFFNAEGWKGRVIDWSLRDDRFRTQLLRFLDVLPALGTDELVVRVFREYLHEAGGTESLLASGADAFARTVPALIAAPVIRSSVRSLGRQFIAGSDPKDALHSIDLLRREGAGVSLDLLGEAVVSEAEAAHHVKRYLELLGFFGPRFTQKGRNGQANTLDISLKLSSFYSQMDALNFEGSAAKAVAALRPVLEQAAEQGATVTFDMEQYSFKDLVIAAFKQVVTEFGGRLRLGIALQAYLRDTPKDLQDLLAWARESGKRIGVRLVKGAYWDYEVVVNRQNGWPVPVFLSKDETDAGFEELTKVLLESTGIVRPAIATHNLRSASVALALAEHLGLGPGDFELQSLYGMGGPLMKAIKRAGLACSTRVYCPIGELLPGIAYLVRRVLENTSNESFFRKTFGERRSLDELLRKPRPDARAPEDQGTGATKEFTNEPATDFSKTANREAMRSALARVRASFGGRYSLVINGKDVSGDEEDLSRNPARPDEIVGRVSRATKSDADGAVDAARKAFLSWSRTVPEERAGYLFGAAREARKRRFDLAALEVYETGKSVREADSDVAEAIDYLEYYGREMVRLGRPRRLGRYAGEINEYRYGPKGVGVVISPWNFPLAIPAGMTAATIVAGNCAILKPSGLAPVIARQLVELFRAARLPEGVLQYLPGPGGEVGGHLVSHPGIDLIAFTGSKEVGLGIVRHAGETRPGQRNVKRVVAEMGGKNAVIVDDTADLDEAVRGVLESAFGYQGQKCSACSRAIVLETVFDRFTERLTEAVKSIVIGPPEEFGTFLGPLIDQNALEKTKGYIERGKKECRPVLVGETLETGFFVGPSLFETGPETAIARDEIFGPLLSLIRAKDFEEALAIANGSEYALTGGVYSRSPVNIAKAKEGFLVGNLYLNRKITGALVGRQPFGGFGMSGVGSKAGGPDYLLQFLHPRTVSENTMRKGSAPLEGTS
jgi:RHH-type proline utilization regulon transcriptional repressor/proline dehydrogenase/delta 1-pyrroline-5-carboxylate dehydrogenase